jgi:hypothetical protein
MDPVHLEEYLALGSSTLPGTANPHLRVAKVLEHEQQFGFAHILAALYSSFLGAGTRHRPWAVAEAKGLYLHKVHYE